MTSTAAMEPLLQHRDEMRASSLNDLFDADPQRAQRLTIAAAGLAVDVSKHFCTARTLELFAQHAQALALRSEIEAMFSGAEVNRTEQRPALHTALRASAATAPNHGEIHAVQQRMQALVETLHRSALHGFDGRAITDVINIGIGGSDLGPRFVTTALKPLHHPTTRVHFVANVDPAELADLLTELNPATTLVIVASKSFTTLETLVNAQTARRWLQHAAGIRSVDAQFVAITANTARAVAFGINAENIFPMWDWVGGRYSLWSAIGLPIAIAVGWQYFDALLRGAEAMDLHYRQTDFSANAPFLLAMLECWYSGFWQAHSALVLPYSHRLRLLPAFLQQLSMESLGKSVTRNAAPVQNPTGLVIWGEPGTNSQHSFMQLLHQGTRFIPVDFIAVAASETKNNGADTDHREQHTHLFANCLSQSRALMTGKSPQEVMQELLAAGMPRAQAETLAPHKVHVGNRPSTTILLDALTPARLGALIALYEHKVHAQSIIWNINAFDQWGVELGKQSANSIYAVLTGTQSAPLDQSTQCLIERFKTLQD